MNPTAEKQLRNGPMTAKQRLGEDTQHSEMPK